MERPLMPGLGACKGLFLAWQMWAIEHRRTKIGDPSKGINGFHGIKINFPPKSHD
jgi:hypothetical protein